MLFMLTDVEDQGVRPETWYALGFAAGVKAALFRRAMTITSLREGVHKRQSLHDEGAAGDSRTVDLAPTERLRWAAFLHDWLDGQGFDVLLEESDAALIAELKAQVPAYSRLILTAQAPHLHIEFDPKAGEQFVRRLPAASAAAAGK